MIDLHLLSDQDNFKKVLIIPSTGVIELTIQFNELGLLDFG